MLIPEEVPFTREFYPSVNCVEINLCPTSIAISMLEAENLSSVTEKILILVESKEEIFYGTVTNRESPCATGSNNTPVDEFATEISHV